jgi:uncharacterized membrane protein
MGDLLEALSRVFGGRATRLVLAIFVTLGMVLFVSYYVVGIIRTVDPSIIPEPVDRFFDLAPKLLSALAGMVAILAAPVIFANVISGLQSESKEYARKISGRDDRLFIPKERIERTLEGTADSEHLHDMIEELRDQLTVLKDRPAGLDVSSPEKLFQAGRQRLLDEAVRIDSISRRNLIIGILFSIIALAVLAWPLIAAAFQQPVASQDFNIFVWASQYYLPRFAVGLLLQFVGFFFLRLYVANELDLKHNKNEITNLEMKMMGVQLAQAFGDAPSKKEILKSLAATERNFLIKKNEKSISTEAMTEYNDMKGLLEKVISKLPGKEK